MALVFVPENGTSLMLLKLFKVLVSYQGEIFVHCSPFVRGCACWNLILNYKLREGKRETRKDIEASWEINSKYWNLIRVLAWTPNNEAFSIKRLQLNWSHNVCSNVYQWQFNLSHYYVSVERHRTINNFLLFLLNLPRKTVSTTRAALKCLFICLEIVHSRKIAPLFILTFASCVSCTATAAVVFT